MAQLRGLLGRGQSPAMSQLHAPECTDKLGCVWGLDGGDHRGDLPSGLTATVRSPDTWQVRETQSNGDVRVQTGTLVSTVISVQVPKKN